MSELAPLLIKPVQRICKYPLLISVRDLRFLLKATRALTRGFPPSQQLLKNTPDTFPYYDELKAGLESVMRVTDKVNEEKRRQDNAQAVTDLAHRVEDWKGHDLSSFGQLLLHENFVVIKSDNEREYSVYLFERIILCCKEVVAQGKKDKKSNSILKRPSSQRINKLQLKGRIFVNNVTAASPLQSRNGSLSSASLSAFRDLALTRPTTLTGQYLLEVRWRGDIGEEAFTIKCRTEELLRQWQKAITRAVEEAPMRRRHHLSASRRSDRGGVPSPASQFPPTPMSETGPQLPSPYPHSDHSGYPSPNYPPGSYGYPNPAQPGYPPGHYAPGQYGFDDDGQDDFSERGTSESGRATPGGGGGSAGARRGPSTRSLPAGDPRDHSGGAAQPGALRPRAHTEDASSHVMSQWRTQPPPPSAPAPLRGMSTHSSSGDAQSLRSSASSRQLRSAPSAEWGGGGGAGPSAGTSSLSSSPAMSYARLPSGSPAPYPDSRYGGAGGNGSSRLPPGASYAGTSAGVSSSGMSRQGSYGTTSGASSQAPLMYRSRSDSSPHMYQQLPSQQQRYIGDSTTQTPDDSHHKRESDSSHGTDRSSASHAGVGGVGGSGGRRGFSSATSSATSFPSPASSAPPASVGTNAVRVKVLFGDDTFVIVVLDSCPYAELVDRVLKKVRACGGAAHARLEAPALRLRYCDEDGDRISITSEEDVAMAFETARAIAAEKGPGAPLELVLFTAVDSAALA